MYWNRFLQNGDHLLTCVCVLKLIISPLDVAACGLKNVTETVTLTNVTIEYNGQTVSTDCVTPQDITIYYCEVSHGVCDNGLTRWLVSPWCRVYASTNRISIGSDNGLSPNRCQAIIWTNAGLLSVGTLWTNFSEILIAKHTFSFKKMHLKISFAK